MRITRSQAHENPALQHEVNATFNQAIGLPAQQVPTLPAALVENLQATFSHSQLTDMVTIAQGVSGLKARVVQLAQTNDLQDLLERATEICTGLGVQLTLISLTYNPLTVPAKIAALQTLQGEVQTIIAALDGVDSIEAFNDAVLDTVDALLNDARFVSIQEELGMVQGALEELVVLVNEPEAAVIQAEAEGIAAQAMLLTAPAMRLFNSLVNNLTS